jgi:uncharacterized phage protein (TIGR02218 family)
MSGAVPSVPPALLEHLASGVTTLCRAWQIIRRDGVRYGFTDHDVALEFDGQSYTPDSGLKAMALQQTTGLSVDNTEAIGALTDASLQDEDIETGRFDGAEVIAWLVNWADPAERMIQFRGNIGEIRRASGAFHAELRGLTDMLNRPVGRVFQRPCGAVLGDAGCGIYLEAATFKAVRMVASVDNARVFRFGDLSDFAHGWFERGRMEILSGPGAGLVAPIKVDRTLDALREITLWEPLRLEIATGTEIALYAGCDKRFETCREKFSNGINYRGFPDIPEEEWMMVHPSNAASLDGGSRR